MDTLPSSIESSFQEAGFSATEILIVRKLLEGDAMTLRDLAFKTGKSTGVLDQAMKKLLKKKIVQRDMINGSPKYVIHSMEAVLKWMQDDTRQKKSMLEMRSQNFESFIASISSDRKRPEMQFFQGDEGLKKAYMLLLEKGNDFVQYGPTLFTETEDPLREFRVQYFRERRKRNIFLRVITHNVPLGRRFQNRDPFEYRKTILVDEHAYPFCFEKIIVGNMVACFHHETKEACFIEYKELAERERQFFEKLWNMKLQKPDPGVQPVADENPLPIMPVAPVVPAKTRILSQVREFFLSPNSIVAITVCILFSGFLTFSLYQRNLRMNLARVQERVRAIVVTGVLQFEVDDLMNIQSSVDTDTTHYLDVIENLQRIGSQNEDVHFTYILRKTADPNSLRFIADTSPIKEYADDLAMPGDLYQENIDKGAFQLALAGTPGVDSEFYSDQWGTFISGAAPIKNKSNEVVAILGVDIEASEIYKLSNESFQPFVYFTFLLIVLLIYRLAAFKLFIGKK